MPPKNGTNLDPPVYWKNFISKNCSKVIKNIETWRKKMKMADSGKKWLKVAEKRKNG